MPDFTGVINTDPGSLFVVVVRTVVVYFVLLLMLRLTGKRQLGQMTPFDLVVLLVISNAVQNAMVGPDTSLSGGLIAALVLVILNQAVVRFVLHAGWVGRQVVGTPTLLVHEGRIIPEHLESEGIDEDEVLQALREHGVDDLSSVKTAVLEVDGTISVIPTDVGITRTRRRIRGHKPAG